MLSQLTILEREKISQMRRSGAKHEEIAVALGRSRSTISREIVRNSVDGVYWAVAALQRSEKHR